VAREVTLSLARLDELFTPISVSGATGSANLPSGVERLVSDLKSGPGAPVTAIVTVPERQLDPGDEDRVRRAVRNYCDVRSSVVESERRALRRLDFEAFRVGIPLLLFGLGLYTLLHRIGASPLVKIYVANGLLLVAAWVGLWYPLDTLVHYGRPYKQELRALNLLRDAELVVRSP
jgi:hypothetical protein